jgi:hypothetical protein
LPDVENSKSQKNKFQRLDEKFFNKQNKPKEDLDFGFWILDFGFWDLGFGI